MPGALRARPIDQPVHSRQATRTAATARNTLERSTLRIRPRMPFGRRGGRGSGRWAGGRHGSRWLAGIRRSAPDPGLPVPALLVPGVRVPLGVDLDSGDRVDTGNSPSPGHHPSGRCGNPLNSTIRAVTRDAETCSRCPARASPLTRTGRGGHRATGGQRPARPHHARVPPFERSWTTVPCSSIDSGVANRRSTSPRAPDGRQPRRQQAGNTTARSGASLPEVSSRPPGRWERARRPPR